MPVTLTKITPANCLGNEELANLLNYNFDILTRFMNENENTVINKLDSIDKKLTTIEQNFELKMDNDMKSIKSDLQLLLNHFKLNTK